MSIVENLTVLKNQLPEGVKLVAVTKTHPVEVILKAYNTGYRIFGENKAQELTTKYSELPKDIEWHMIGHLQTNKVKFIAPFVSLIHAVDSLKLLTVIDNEALKNKRVISCLFQIKIAQEESKFGLGLNELYGILNSEEFWQLKNIRIAGLMGMATFTEDMKQVRKEFKKLSDYYKEVKLKFFADSPYFKELSMGMSEDYKVAIEEGATIIRVGSIIFGERNYIKI